MPCASYRLIESSLREDLENATSSWSANRGNHQHRLALEKAAQRFNDFILNRTIPADLVTEIASARVLRD